MINEVTIDQGRITGKKQDQHEFDVGVSGDPISIVANYIRILSKPSWQLYQYHIGEKILENIVLQFQRNPYFDLSRF